MELSTVQADRLCRCLESQDFLPNLVDKELNLSAADRGCD